MDKYFFSTLDSIPNRKYKIIGTFGEENTKKSIFRFVYNSVDLTDANKKEIKSFFDHFDSHALIGIKQGYQRVSGNILNSLHVCWIGTLIKFIDDADYDKPSSKKKIIFG